MYHNAVELLGTAGIDRPVYQDGRDDVCPSREIFRHDFHLIQVFDLRLQMNEYRVIDGGESDSAVCNRESGRLRPIPAREHKTLRSPMSS